MQRILIILFVCVLATVFFLFSENFAAHEMVLEPEPLLAEEAPDYSVEVPDSAPITTKKMDLNGDGKLETIRHFVTGSNVEGKTTIIAINDVGMQAPGHNPEYKFYFVDLDKTDTSHEVAVTDDGPSTDYTTTFFSFDAEGMHSLGTIPGALSQMTIKGDGKVTTIERAQVLDTWFFHQDFILADKKLEAVHRDFYERIGSKSGVRLLVPFVFLTEPKKDADKFPVSAGIRGKILGCDNVAWCKAEFNGEQVWFELKDGFRLVSSDLSPTEVFEGLSNAD
jgi:hypothetical protein